jgi:hypothetical protein
LANSYPIKEKRRFLNRIFHLLIFVQYLLILFIILPTFQLEFKLHPPLQINLAHQFVSIDPEYLLLYQFILEFRLIKVKILIILGFNEFLEVSY